MLIIITIVTIISPLHPCTVVNVICDEGAYSDWTITRQLNSKPKFPCNTPVTFQNS